MHVRNSVFYLIYHHIYVRLDLWTFFSSLLHRIFCLLRVASVEPKLPNMSHSEVGHGKGDIYSDLTPTFVRTGLY